MNRQVTAAMVTVHLIPVFTNGDSLCMCESEIRLKNESEALSETCSVLGIIKTPNVFKM